MTCRLHSLIEAISFSLIACLLSVPASTYQSLITSARLEIIHYSLVLCSLYSSLLCCSFSFKFFCSLPIVIPLRRCSHSIPFSSVPYHSISFYSISFSYLERLIERVSSCLANRIHSEANHLRFPKKKTFTNSFSLHCMYTLFDLLPTCDAFNGTFFKL